MDRSHSHDDMRVLGDFELIRELGRGGMGVVYEARQRSLNRRVALKALSSGAGLTTKAIMRFKREAEAAAKLHHSNIVPIYATGEEDRVPYYAMELIDGPSLDQVIKQMRGGPATEPVSALDATVDEGSVQERIDMPSWVAERIGHDLSSSSGSAGASGSGSLAASTIGSGGKYFDRIAAMFADVADALAHAHDQGVIHRDMKPSNLLLSKDGRLSINDFGLARMLEQPGMTMTGEFVGSPTYMSPEQIVAGRVPIDHRTDIYSLGAALYELMTLQSPFPGERRDQVLSQIIHKEPERPRAINKQVPKDLETICLKALEKDPDRRYQTADLMAKDLRAFVNRHAISARRVGRIERSIRWAKRNKMVTALASLLLIVGVVASVLLYKAHLDQIERDAIAKQKQDELDRENRRLKMQKAKENALTVAMSGDLDEAIDQINLAKKHGAKEDWALVLLGMVDDFEGNWKGAVEKLKAAVRLNPENVLAQFTLANVYARNGRWKDFEKRQTIVMALKPESAEEYLAKGNAMRMAGNDEGMELIDQAVDMRRDFYLAWVSRAWAKAFQGLDQDKQSLIDEAMEELKTVEKMAGPDFKNNPRLIGTRLYVRLAAFYLGSRQGKDSSEKAQAHLIAAEDDVKLLEQMGGRFFMGNVMRLHYYYFKPDREGMDRVMDDVIKYDHRGYVSDIYFAVLYREREFAKALNVLARLDQDDTYWEFRRVAFLMEEASNKPDAQEQYDRIYRENIHLMDESLWLDQFLGKHEEAIDKAKRMLDGTDPLLAPWYTQEMLEYLSEPPTRETEEKWLSKAGESQLQLMTAHATIAWHKLAHGDREGARASFERAASCPVFHWTTAIWAREFEARLREDPTWPPWIPAEPAGTEAE